MFHYTLAEFDFVSDEMGSVDVLFGESSVGHFTIPVGCDRTGFIAECENYYANEMVY